MATYDAAAINEIDVVVYLAKVLEAGDMLAWAEDADEFSTMPSGLDAPGLDDLERRLATRGLKAVMTPEGFVVVAR